MTDLLRWILGSFWRYVGAIFLIAVVGEALCDIIRAFRSAAATPRDAR